MISGKRDNSSVTLRLCIDDPFCECNSELTNNSECLWEVHFDASAEGFNETKRSAERHSCRVTVVCCMSESQHVASSLTLDHAVVLGDPVCGTPTTIGIVLLTLSKTFEYQTAHMQ